MSTLIDWVDSTPERRRAFAQEKLIASVAEDIWAEMENAGVSKAELARRLGKSKAYVTQLLNGSRNMTLRTLADIAHCLGSDVQVSLADAALKPKSVGSVPRSPQRPAA